MSSLRLALKQSLQETGHLASSKDKKKKGGAPRRKQSRQRGDAPRKRGRPPKRSRSDPTSDDDDDDDVEDSSENEFSYDSDESHDDSDEDSQDDEEEDDGIGDDDEDDDDESHGVEEDHGDDQEMGPPDDEQTAIKTSGYENEDDSLHHDGAEDADNEEFELRRRKKLKKAKKLRQREEMSASDEERRRQRKLLKKQLKHSAANKIQTHWKNKKRLEASTSAGENDAIKSNPTPKEIAAPTEDTAAPRISESEQAAVQPKRASSPKENGNDQQHQQQKQKQQDQRQPEPHPQQQEQQQQKKQEKQQEEEEQQQQQQQQQQHQQQIAKKKRKKGQSNSSDKSSKSSTVTPPIPEVLEWARSLSERKCRKNVKPGLRVKVRFVIKVKREGKQIKKKLWYGGRVSAVSKEGSKIRIKYDDGTTEISKFPDKDVVVDETDNGQHLVSADKFIPPLNDDMEEEGEMFLEDEVELKSNLEKSTNDTSRVSSSSSPPPPPLPADDKTTSDVPAPAPAPVADSAPVPAAPSPTPASVPAPEPEPTPILIAGNTEKMIEKMKEQSVTDSAKHERHSEPVPDKTNEEKEKEKPTIVINAPIADTVRTDSKDRKEPLKQKEPMQDRYEVEDSKMQSSVEITPNPKKKHDSKDGKNDMAEIGSPEEGELSPGHTFPSKESTLSNEIMASSPVVKKETKDTVISDRSFESNDFQRNPTEVLKEEKTPQKVPPSSPLEKERKENSGIDKDEKPAVPHTPKPSLTIRISNIKSDERSEPTVKAVRSKPRAIVDDEDDDEEEHGATSEEEELFADTPVTERKVKSIDMEKMREKEGSRKRSGSDASIEAPPSKRRIHVKRDKAVAAMEIQEENRKRQDAKDSDPTDFGTTSQTTSAEDAAEALTSISKVSESNDEPRRGSKTTISLTLRRPATDLTNEEGTLTSGKMKRKKGERAMSPKGRKSPLNQRRSPITVARSESPSQIIDQPDESSTIVTKPVFKQAAKASMESAPMEISGEMPKHSIGSQNSAFARKQLPASTKEVREAPEVAIPAENDEVQTGDSKPLSRASSKASTESLPSVRSGRRAAQQAKEKLNSKQENASAAPESGKKKKKRRRIQDDEEESDHDDDPQWVQCDKCGKWRIIPKSIVSSLPKHWYCHLNVHDPKRNNCTAPEQTPKQYAKERRRAKKRARQLRAEQAELEAMQEEAKKESTIDDRPNTPTTSPKVSKGVISPKPGKNVTSPKGTKGVVSSRKQGGEKGESKRASPMGAEYHSQDSGNEFQPKLEKKGKKGRPASQPPQPDAAETTQPIDKEMEGKKAGRRRGRPARNANRDQEKKDDDNVEWVQCEKCEKWRKLPPHICADELPEVWYCSMNDWNPESASCDSPEDKADAHHQEIGNYAGQVPQGNAGKFSYRSMIFGTGRKHNRPMSERTRAAESLFMRPINEDENPHPSVMYAKSSAFLPRVSNFTKANTVEEKKPGIFDVLSNSDLFNELRGIGQPIPMLSTSSSLPSLPRFLTYENLPENTKVAVKEAVLHSLGNGVLSADELISEAQNQQWETLLNDVNDLRSILTADIIVNTLLSLVRDGVVEMTCFRDRLLPLHMWVPKYRRVTCRRDSDADSALKNSRCMKISKPWKQKEENNSEWVSGGAAFA